MKAKQIAQYGLLIAMAMILSYVEAQIPAFFAVPGMKLGLTNVVVLYALYCMGDKSALMINFIRIFLVSMLFGNGISIAYSIAGGLLSGLVMIILKKTGKFGIVTVSIAGGVAHNIGQILVAMYLLEVTAIAWYLLILWFTGIVSGLLIGILGGELCKRLRKIDFGGNDGEKN
jgi:heptaprenyl diphosphate synthase